MQIDMMNGSNVISLEPRKMEGHFPAVNEVEGYWTALSSHCGGLPSRAQVDPRGIEGALHYAFVLERIAPGVARFRLAGMHLADLMGMEIRGMPLTAMFLPEARPAVAEALDRAFDTPSKVTLVLSGERGIGRGPLEARMILLPLLDEEGKVTRLLGALEAKGQIGRQPRRFGVLETRYADLAVAIKNPRVEPARREPAPAAPTQIHGFAEPAAKYAPPRRPHLRLVQTDEN